VSSSVRIDPGLGTGALGAGHPVQPLLRAALGRGARTAPTRAPGPTLPWAPDHFALDGVTRFRRASAAARHAILAGCAEDLLTEAYFIEKLGLAFTAKMVLLSESTEERMLYALFAGDEARHLDAIRAHVPDPATGAAAGDPFLRLLADAITDGSKPTLAYLVQVVLEGWGLVHYQSLARSCRSASLRATLRRLLKDEALHHGSGVALVGRQGLGTADHAHVVEVLVRLFEMVQAGPRRVVARVEEATGPLSAAERATTFRELDTGSRGQARLERLRALTAVQPAVLAALERHGVTVPWSPEVCARRDISPHSP
jgi:hypothetical protein